MNFSQYLDYINGENTSLALFAIGIYALCARRNIIKTIIGLSIIQSAVVLFFLSINNAESAVAPIGAGLSGNVADPIPQALMITAIVVGISVTAVSLTMFISIYHNYGLKNWNRVKIKRGGIK